jgi:folylpolyglutamate synthase/dihydropteroate synthase
LPRLQKLARINFAFLDGAHDYKTVKYEFLFVSKRQKKNDLLILDDVTKDKFNGIVKLVEEIESNKSYNVKLIESETNRGYAILKKN